MLARASFGRVARGSRRHLCRSCIIRARWYTSAAESQDAKPVEHPLVLKLRDDLKTAMRSKDKERLAVLRSALAEIANRTKIQQQQNKSLTSTMILSLLSKQIAAAHDASMQFQKGDRLDLAQKEDSQATMLNEYVDLIETPTQAELQETVKGIIRSRKDQGEKVDLKTIRETAVKILEEDKGKALEMKDLMGVVQAALGK